MQINKGSHGSVVKNTAILGVDAGGTFTDFVCLQFDGSWQIAIHKTLSTPDAPEQAILQGIAELGLTESMQQGSLRIIHGSTVATNAALEGNTAKTALVTNYGFGDVLTLARQTRPKLYALEHEPVPPPVPPELCLETGGRLTAQGEVLVDLDQQEIEVLLDKLRTLEPEAVAINLLFSFLDDRFERAIEDAINAAGISAFVSRSSTVLPVYKEYERGIATWLNASLGPVVQGYLSRLQQQLGSCSLQIMQSSGETMAAHKAADAAVHLLLSGPAGGLAAIKHLGAQMEKERIISFDMGGTSTDVALLDAEIGMTTESRIGRYPVAVPSVDMHTIGAGGGSIAFIDSGGLLQVGPRSAGANPGPACYGQGGTSATVTDANLVLGRLLASADLAGGLSLDIDLARRVVGKLANQVQLSVEETALGIVNIANELMAKAIREISVNRGHDPKDFILISFGGAGGLHVCALAEAMDMNQAMVPARGGVLSALGMLVAPKGRQFTRTISVQADAVTDAQVMAYFEELETYARSELQEEQIPDADLQREPSIDVRYAGQSYSLNLPWRGTETTVGEFHALHEKRYGYCLNGPAEFVNLRLHLLATDSGISLPPEEASATPCKNPGSARVYGHSGMAKQLARADLAVGESIAGPAIITEYSATTYVAGGWSVTRDEWGNLLLSRMIENA